jgi:hypothetical protein
MGGSQFDVRCVYTNDQLPGQLTIVKNANGGNDTFSFAYGVTGQTPNAFSLTTAGGTAQQTFQITTGLGETYRVLESLTTAQVNDGWRIDSATCYYDDDPTTPIGTVQRTAPELIAVDGFTIDAGDAVTCTFVNNAPALVTVTKVAQGGDGTFEFITNSLPGGNFSLTTTGGSASTLPITVPIPDSSTGVLIDILENIIATPGWNLADITCSGTTENANGNLVTFTAQPGNVINCTFTNVADGQITIVKDTEGGDGTFEFTTDVPGATSPFTITTANNTGSASVASPPANATYFIRESGAFGWDLTDISCTGQVSSTVTYTGATTSPTDAFEPGDDTANIDLQAGEDITCTFTNTQRGTIEIVKALEAQGPGPFGPFGFTSDIPGPGNDSFIVLPSLPTTFNGLVPGTFTVTEDDPNLLTPQFDLTALVCDDSVTSGGTDSTVDPPNREATINLDPGETVTCTFTNTQRANLTIRKAITVDSADTSAFDNTFDFTSTTLPNASFSLAPTLAATPETAEFFNLVPGTYDVAEDVSTALANGWALVNTFCSDGNSSVDAIMLEPGENVVCTFVNAPLGSATIIKNTVGGDDTFDYIGTAPFQGLTLDTSIIGGTASADFTNQLNPLNNPYSITENTPLPAGWALTKLECDELGGTDSTGNPLNTPSTEDLDALTATINADYNETVTCTFTNTADGSLAIRKQTAPADVDVPFTFTGTEASLTGQIRDFDIAAEQLLLEAQPGIYSTTETVPLGWQITGIACSGQSQSTVTYTGATTSPTDGFELGDDTVNVTLAAGEDVTCEFTNTQESSITIVKSVVGAGGTFNFGSAALGDFSLNPADNATDQQNFPGLLPGQFMVAETPVPAGWALTDIACTGGSSVLIGVDDVFTDGDTGVTINLAAGEDVICTFENTQDMPAIEVTKTGTLNDDDGTPGVSAGDTISYVFTVTNTGNVTLTNVTITDPDATISGGPLASLDPGVSDSTTFTGSHTVTQVEIDSGSFTNMATATGDCPQTQACATDTDSDTQQLVPPRPPSDIQAIPVNDRWALLLMALLLLAVGWYYRPALRRDF